MVVGRGLYQQCFYLSDRKPTPPLGFQDYVDRFPKSYQNAAQKSAHELDNLFKLKTDGNIDIQGTIGNYHFFSFFSDLTLHAKRLLKGLTRVISSDSPC